MAKISMRQLTICAPRDVRAPLLSLLQRYGEFEPVSEGDADEVFARSDTARTRAEFEKSSTAVRAALAVLDEVSPAKAPPLSMLAGRQEISEEDYRTREKKNEKTLARAENILEQNRRIAELKAENVRLSGLCCTLEPWKALDVPTGFAGTKTTTALIGTLPGGVGEEVLGAALAEKLPDAPVHFRIVSQQAVMVCLFALAPAEQAAAVEEVLRTLGFVRANPTQKPPAEEIADAQQRIEENKKQTAAARQKISDAADVREELRFYLDWCAMRVEKYEVLGGLLQSEHTFFLTGYLPADRAEALASVLHQKFGAAVQVSDPAPGADVPVALSNNGFSAPVESVVESYSMPSKNELDPTFVMSLFYYLLFGLMLSDAGYGLLMVLGCGIALARFKTMESGMKNTLKMFLFCGISTMFWGILQGSFFGDVIGVVATTFFHSSVSLAPVWFAPLDDPMRMLLFALALGVVHLFCGLAMNIVQHFKNKEYLDALYDGVFWYMLVGGLIVLLMTSTMFDDLAKFHLTLPAAAMTALYAVILVGSVGIILTAGRESKNWFKRLLKGAYGLYNVTGYLSDILSYSRLLALGLATGVIATIINMMAAMAAGNGGIMGAILFIVIFLLGHTINMGINLLGAYVHTNRLQFVEFFGKFYSGGGHKFAPFGVHTKYYKLSKEELTND